MTEYPHVIKDIAMLEDLLSEPAPGVIELFQKLKGDILFLGAAGKIGPSLMMMAKKACDRAGVKKKLIGVSRFSDKEQKQYLSDNGMDIIQGDLMEPSFFNNLPLVENVFFLAGMKFGSSSDPSKTWAVNTYLPGLVADKYKDSKIVAYSTGCVYPFVPITSGGCTENDPPDAVGEYAQSCLGRERMFEYGSQKHSTLVTLIRLNYAVEMRYGVLLDVAQKVKNQKPIDLSMGYANVIWQGDANADVLQALDICQSPAKILNVTGPGMISIRKIAEQFADIFNEKPVFVNKETDTAWLSNASHSHDLFGSPRVSLAQVIKWTGDWLKNDMPTLNKPSKFEIRNGKY